MRIRHLASIMIFAYKNVESLAKDLSNTKAVLDIGWSNNEKRRKTLGCAKVWQKQ
jgi:hypothetical protein